VERPGFGVRQERGRPGAHHGRRGKRDDARKAHPRLPAMLKSIDDQMREEKMPLKQSPMVECRFLLGILLEEDGRKAMMPATTRPPCPAEGVAEQSLHVYSMYAESAWRPRRQTRRCPGGLLEARGAKSRCPRPT